MTSDRHIIIATLFFPIRHSFFLAPLLVRRKKWRKKSERTTTTSISSIFTCSSGTNQNPYQEVEKRASLTVNITGD